MKLKLTFYTDTGKHYTSGEVEIPNEIKLWDSNFIDIILDTQKIVSTPRKFNIVVDDVEGEEYDGFFKSLYTIQYFKSNKGNVGSHPPFYEATRLYDNEVSDRFKWDNLSNNEKELLESYIIKASYFTAYSDVFQEVSPTEEFMSFYDRVVINYYNYLSYSNLSL